MKRILSMMLVVMMLAMSLTSVVFAAEVAVTVTFSDATVKLGNTADVAVSFSAATLQSGGLQNFTIKDSEGNATDKVTIKTYGTWTLPGNPLLTDVDTTVGKYAFAYTANTDFTTAVSIPLTVQVAADAAEGEYKITCETSFASKGDTTAISTTEGTITVVDEVTLTTAVVDPASVAVSYGADAEAIKAALSEVKVTGKGTNSGGKEIKDIPLTVEWDASKVDTTKMADDEVVASAVVAGDAYINNIDKATVKVTVTKNPLTAATAGALLDVTVKKGTDGTDDAVKQAIIEGNATITLKDEKTGATDTVALTADMITVADATEAAETVLDTAEAGNKTTATIKLNKGTESVNKIFKLAEDMKVAEIEISVKASSGGYTPSGIGKPIGGNVNVGDGVTEDNKTEDGETTEDGKIEDGETTEDGKIEDGETTEDSKIEDGEFAGEFADVAADYWAADYITVLKDMGIINGKEDGKFEPEAQLTRAEFAKMIAVAMNLTATATESTFADCGADDWYTPFVIAVNEAGFVNGKGDAFDANGSISRQEICTILGRIVGVTEGAALAFADAADVADWAADGVAAMVSLGVVNGYEDNTFKGAANATRAEVSKMLVAFLTAIADKEEAPADEDIVEGGIVEDIVEEDIVEEDIVEEDDANKDIVDDDLVLEEEVEEAPAAE